MISIAQSAGSKGTLFETKVVQRYLDDHQGWIIPDEPGKVQALREWLESLPKKGVPKKEPSLEERFGRLVLEQVLGYLLWPTSGAPASLWSKPPSSITNIRQEPDRILGKFPQDSSNEEFRIDAVLELKSPGVPYDAPQDRKEPFTPVEQAFYYAERIIGVRWVLVSDMKSFRLYSVDSRWAYESFVLANCIDSSGRFTDEFRRLYFFLHHDKLIEGGQDSSVSKLYNRSTQGRLEIAKGFYDVYDRIRRDLFEAVSEACAKLTPPPDRNEIVEGVQRLLDRMLFLLYCEDHPDQLIPKGTFVNVINAVRKLPGSTGNSIYENLKKLFREVDIGSSPTSWLSIYGYNGELFKPHRVIDAIELPDSLSKKTYETKGAHNTVRKVHGVWGLHEYNYWSELDEHVLGRIFEESLSDLVSLRKGEETSIAEKLDERKSFGIFYTTNILSDFLSGSAISAILEEKRATSADEEDLAATFKTQYNDLSSMKILDPTCGSGAFLVSSYKNLLKYYWRVREAIRSLDDNDGQQYLKLDFVEESLTQAGLLRNCLYGVDLLPQSVEIAKLSLWLRSARPREKVSDLSSNLTTGDSLDPSGPLSVLGFASNSLDLVIGNPPWGGEIKPEIYKSVLANLGLPLDTKMDSWELFLRVGVKMLRQGGRVAMVIPDSFLYPEKWETRKFLFDNTRIEKLHYIGPDWFGPGVRMATVLLQARKGPCSPDDRILAMMLAGDSNRKARKGQIPLSQFEAQEERFVRSLPMKRSLEDSSFAIKVFRDEKDDAVIEKMIQNSVPLSKLCVRYRGEEMSKTGLLWICPNCLIPTTPGKKKKGGLFEDKYCPKCNLLLTSELVTTDTIVHKGTRPSGNVAPFIDGDDINHRYVSITPDKWISLDVPGVDFKDADSYASPKILIRQAGIGILATLDHSNSRCPQSVYMYRLTSEYKKLGYQHEFVLGALLSRTMAYYVFKEYAEVDPAKAHAKLTHDRLANLPIPKLNVDQSRHRELHDSVVNSVRLLLSGTSILGSQEDLAIESALRELWGLTPEEGSYVNGQFADLPDSQIISDLFPRGRIIHKESKV